MAADHEHPQPSFNELIPLQADEVRLVEVRPGLREAEVIGENTLGAQHLWFARISAEPRSGISPAHHHLESEAGVYVLTGSVSFFFGEGLSERVDLHPGDFLYIPGWTIHAEANLGDEKNDLLMVRSTPSPIAEYLRDIPVPNV